MFSATNVPGIQNLPTAPGDSVRDNKTNTTFVIQGAMVAAGTLATTYYLINATTGKLTEMVGDDTLASIGMHLVRRNVESLSPEDARNLRIDTIRRVLKGNEDLLRKLGNSRDGTFLTDLLLMVNDMPEEALKDKFRQLADALVESTDRTYSKTDLLRLFNESLGGSVDIYGNEHLDRLAEWLSEYTSVRPGLITNASKVIRKSPGSMESVLAGFRRTKEGEAGVLDQFLQSVLGKRNDRLSVAYNMTSRDQVYKFFTSEGFMPTMTAKRSVALEELATIKNPVERDAALVAEVLGLNRDDRIVREIAKSLSSTDKKFNALRNAFLDADPRGMFSIYQRYSTTGRKGPNARAYNREVASSIANRYKARPRIVAKDLYARIDAAKAENTNTLVGLKQSAFLDDIVGLDRTVRLTSNGRVIEGTLRDNNHLAAVRKALAGNETIFATADTMRGTANGVIELDQILTENNAVKNSVEGIHTLRFDNNQSAIFPLNHSSGINFATEAEAPVAQPNIISALQTGGQISAYTNDITNRKPLISDNIKRVTTGPPVDAAMESYERVRGQTRMADVIVKGANGVEHRATVVSDLPIPVTEQLQRNISAAKIHDASSLILDIESDADTGRVWQIGTTFGSLADTEGEELYGWTSSSARTILEEAQGIASLSEKINTASYIGQQHEHDFPTLISRAQQIADSAQPGETVMLGGESVDLREGMLGVAASLRNKMSSSGYDLTVGAEAARFYGDIDFSSGGVNQARLTRDVLGDEVKQTHTATKDTLDAGRIQQRLDVGSLEFRVEDDTNTVVQGRGTRIGNLDGEFLKKVGIEESPTEGLTAYFQTMRYNETSNKFELVGAQRKISAESSSQLHSMLEGFVPVGGLDQFADPSAISDALEYRSGRIDESVGRFLRGIQPFNKTFLDETEMFDPYSDLTFGHYNLFAAKLADDWVKSPDMEIIAKTRTNRETAEVATKRMLQHMRLYVDATTPDVDPFDRRIGLGEAVSNWITGALDSDNVREVLDRLSRFSKTRHGQILNNLMMGALRDDDLVAKATATLYATRLLAASPKADALYSNPRLSLRAFEPSHAYDGVVNQTLHQGTTGQAVESSVHSLIGQTFIAAGDGNTDAKDLLTSIFNSPEELENALAATKDYADSRRGRSNLEALEATTSSMFHVDRSSPVYKAVSSVDRSSRFLEEVRTQVLGRADEFIKNASDLGIDYPATTAMHYENIVQEEFNKSGSASEAVSNTYERLTKELGTDKAWAFFRDPVGARGAVDLEKLNMTDSEATDAYNWALEKASTLIDASNGLGGPAAMAAISSEAQELRIAALRADKSVSEIASMQVSMVNEATAALIENKTANFSSVIHEVASKFVNQLTNQPNDIKMSAELAMQAAGAHAVQGTTDLWAGQHAAALGKGIFNGAEMMSKVSVPLLAVGGVLALMAASNVNEHYSGGNLSEDTPGRVSAYSEIPGSPGRTRVFHGEADPFQVSITFDGYVKDQRQKQLIQQKVYDVVTGKMRTARVSKTERDERVNDRQQLAVDQLRSLV